MTQLSSGTKGRIVYTQRQSNQNHQADRNESHHSVMPTNANGQQASPQSPEKTICLLIFNQAIAESLCQNLIRRGKKAIVLNPDNTEEFLRHNNDAISLAVVDPLINSQGSMAFVDLLKLLGVPYILIDSMVRSMHLAQSLRDNSCGYLTYDCSLESLLGAISNLADGEINHYWCPEAAEMIDYSGKKPKLNSTNSLSCLTERQLEVLSHLAEGKTVKEVAHILHLSHKSVDSHKYRIMNRLHVHDRVHLSRFAIREGLIEP